MSSLTTSLGNNSNIRSDIDNILQRTFTSDDEALGALLKICQSIGIQSSIEMFGANGGLIMLESACNIPELDKAIAAVKKSGLRLGLNYTGLDIPEKCPHAHSSYIFEFVPGDPVIVYATRDFLVHGLRFGDFGTIYHEISHDNYTPEKSRAEKHELFSSLSAPMLTSINKASLTQEVLGVDLAVFRGYNDFLPFDEVRAALISSASILRAVKALDPNKDSDGVDYLLFLSHYYLLRASIACKIWAKIIQSKDTYCFLTQGEDAFWQLSFSEENKNVAVFPVGVKGCKREMNEDANANEMLKAWHPELLLFVKTTLRHINRLEDFAEKAKTNTEESVPNINATSPSKLKLLKYFKEELKIILDTGSSIERTAKKSPDN